MNIKKTKKKVINNKKIINIYWIRHGLSCANIHKYLHPFKKDPQLTYDGLECSEKIRKYVPRNIDLIFSSGLKRAIETALSMFYNRLNKNKKIISVPFISEKGLGLDNMKSDLKNLNNYFKPVIEKINLEFHSKTNKLNINPNDIKKADIKKFFKFLAIYLKNNKKEKLNIAIITHSHFMKNNNIGTNEKGKKPNNNSIYKIKYEYNVNKDIENFYKIHQKKKISNNSFNGCIFSSKKYKYIRCTKNSCKKTPKETYKNYIRCKNTNKYYGLKKFKN